ncbi:MAG: FGGY-family carbohydrate kinase [Chlamydiia bacterium]
MEIYLGVDIGTTSIKAALVSEEGKILAFTSTPNPLQRQGHKVRQDVFHLLQKVCETIDRCIEESSLPLHAITLMAVTSQRESFAFFDSSGTSPLFCWQDTTKPDHLNLSCNRKIATLDTLFFHHLSDKRLFITDPTQSSYARFEGCSAQRADLIPSKGNFGSYRGIPIKASIADQPSSLYALGRKIVLSLGTGAFLLAELDADTEKPFEGKKYTGVENGEKNVFYTERSIPYLAPIFNTVIQKFSPHQTFKEFESLAASTFHSKGLFYHPELSIFKGFQATSGGAEWSRSILEGFVFSIKEMIDLMQKSQHSLYSTIPITGGVSKLNYLCQLLSDLSGLALVRPKCPETALLGAIKLASGNSLKKLLEEEITFIPQPNGVLQKSYALWRETFYAI